MDDSNRQTHGTPHLFLLRLWREELAPGRGEWRGQMTSLASGEVRYFRSPETLYKILLTMLSHAPSTDDAWDSDGEGGESADERKARSVLKGEYPEMSTISSWRHCVLVYSRKPGTGPGPLGPIPTPIGPMPRVRISYMDRAEPFEKQFSDFDAFEDVVKWFGSHGWELAGVIASDSDGPMSYYFKRAD